MGKGSKAPAAPDPYKTAQAEAQFNRLDTYSPSGSGVRYGYSVPDMSQVPIETITIGGRRSGVSGGKGGGSAPTQQYKFNGQTFDTLEAAEQYRASLGSGSGFVQGVAPPGYQSAVQQIESPWEKAIREALQPASVDLTNRVIRDTIYNMPDAPRVQDRGDVAKTIFDRSFAMMQPAIEKSNSRLLNNLQARGIPIGSEAFNDAYGEQQTRTQDTISRLAMDADMAAGQEQSRLFGLDQASRQGSIAELVAAMGGNYNPPSATPSGNAQSVNYGGLVGQKYQADMSRYQADQAMAGSTMATLGGLGGAMLLKGGSDRRLKRDIRLVGRRGPLNLYEYRYFWDQPGTVRRGYMAQEVVKLFPRAVFWVLGFMALDYEQLPEV